MKKYIIIIILLASFKATFAQEKVETTTLQKGNYIRTAGKEELSGKWASPDGSYAISINFEKKQMKKGKKVVIDFYYDGIRLGFEKVLKDGKNVSYNFQGAPIQLISSNGKDYLGSYQDPLTKNHVSLELHIVGHKMKMTSRINTAISKGNISDGVTFPYELTFTKKVK